MEIDRKKYISKYVDEGLEIVTLAEGLLFDIKDGISPEDDLPTMLRALHTLKGTSRMLEFKRIEKLSHSLESVFISLKEQRIGMTANAVKLVLATLDLIKGALGIVQKSGEDEIDISVHAKALDALAENEEYTLPDEGKKEAETPAENQEETETDDGNDSENETGQDHGAKRKQNVKAESIRLPIGRIDDIIKNIASMQSIEIAAKAISVDAEALDETVKAVSAKLKTIKNRDTQLRENIRKLERISDRINSGLKNYSADASNSIHSAYDSVISLRTVPLTTILDSYPRFVYQLADELGKKIHLNIEGQENEIDKNIIESISEILVHIVRNAIDHGVESVEDRLAAGKSETGNISITCLRESGNMKIVIKDDGKGIDHEKIRKRAVKDGFVSEAVAASLTEEELGHFIFKTGFSTSSHVSSVSGRGVGMDIVAKCIEDMKGSIIVDSTMGEGTSFTITVPLSIAAMMGFPVTCGTMKFIIPATFVDTIMLVMPDDIVTIVDRPELKYNGRLIKLYYMDRLLNTRTTATSSEEPLFVVIVRAYDDIAALAVNDIGNMRSVILKTVPAFMEGMSVFSGIVLNENYEMVSVLHIPTVIKMAKRIKTIDLKKRNIGSENMQKSILVVDDSRPTREIEMEILASEGYIVDTACDGSDALKAAKGKHYDLICTDINMPVMDGFTLIENIRKNEDLCSIPIIVISSQANPEDLKRSEALGASRFIVKNSFNNSNLIEAVTDLIGAGHG